MTTTDHEGHTVSERSVKRAILTGPILVFGTLLLAAGTIGHDLHRQVPGALFVALFWADDAIDRIVEAIRARADR